MGVIRDSRIHQNSVSSDPEEDTLSDFIESADDMRLTSELSQLAELERRRKRTRRSCKSVKSQGSDIDGLSSRLLAHKGHRKQRRLQNEKQLKALWSPEDELEEISIYDFVEKSVSAFALMIQEKDNLTLWNAMLEAEPDYVSAEVSTDKRAQHPAFSPDECFKRLDSDMKRTLKRHRCPIDLISNIEQQIEKFFTSSPADVFRTNYENSFARLMLHAVCEYMDLKSKSLDLDGSRWTLVKNIHPTFVVPVVPLSEYLESRKKTSLRR